MKRGSRRATVDRAPQPMRGVGADIKIRIERRLGRASDAELRSLFQPQVMLRSLNAQNGMPPVRCLSDAGRRKISNWQAYADGFRSGCALFSIAGSKYRRRLPWRRSGSTTMADSRPALSDPSQPDYAWKKQRQDQASKRSKFLLFGRPATKQVTIAVVCHPSCSGQMAIKSIAGLGGFAIRINLQHDSSHFSPISAVGFGIKKSPIRHQMRRTP